MSDLFNNPLVNRALKNMTPDQLNQYKEWGKYMYGNTDYVSTQINGMAPEMEDAVAYIEEAIKSGISPQDLTEKEVQFLMDAFGPDWYKKYGFERHEVHEPGLNLATKKKFEELIEKKITSENSKSEEKLIQEKISQLEKKK